MTRAGLAVALGAALSFACASPVARSASQAAAADAVPSRPHIIVIVADDQGWGDLSLHGNPAISTPRIDSLGRDGAQFERFYVSTVCSPTRAELLTGRYHPRGGVTGTSVGAERLDLDERTIAEIFKDAGYATGLFGKWHSGTQSPYHPNARGFDEFYGFTSGHWAHYFAPVLDHNGERVTGEGYLPDDLTTRAMAFLMAQRDRPVFMVLSYNTPHSPMQVPDAYWNRVKDRPLPPHRYRDDEDEPHTRAALAMVENLDDNVGRLLDLLDREQLADNTVVAYLSDNGPNGWRWNGDMKGRKGTVDEGGLRSPLLIRWPGRIQAGRRVSSLASTLDLMPTFAELADVPLPSDRPLDGQSLASHLHGEGVVSPDRMIVSFGINGRQVSVRTQRYRLDPAGALFDMQADPGQRRDVAAEHPDVVAVLRAHAARVAEDVGYGAPQPDRPFTVGHAPRTSLPARDGIPHGGVTRSSRHPNDSYFTTWTSPDGAVTWDVDVMQAADYEVEALYAVPAGDVGATVRLTFGEASVTTRISEAHDPPIIGPADDRSPRTESPTKDFRRVRLGAVRLQAGRGVLRVTAPAIPGSQAWELAGLELTRPR